MALPSQQLLRSMWLGVCRAALQSATATKWRQLPPIQRLLLEKAVGSTVTAQESENIFEVAVCDDNNPVSHIKDDIHKKTDFKPYDLKARRLKLV